MKKLFFLYGFILLFLVSCDQDEILDTGGENGIDSVAVQNKLVNEWTYKLMSDYYYWESELPQLNSIGSDDPFDFYESLLNVNDHWSYMVDDYAALTSELAGVPESMGYSPKFYLFQNGEKKNVMIVVEYVFPNSPAEMAGLKRGDVILQIDGAFLTIDDYYKKYSKKSYTVTLGAINKSNMQLSLTDTEIALNAAIITADPTIYSTVYDTMGIQIGYMVYTSFTTGNNNVFLETIDNVVDEFKAAGIDELIVDLRYNGGGSPDAATHLASAIAPITYVENNDVLIKLTYNGGLTDYYKSEFGANSDAFLIRFPENNHNLDLDRVHFLTTNGSASASELLMIALAPYMETVLVGDTTYGKFTGMYVMGDNSSDPEHNYGILPVVMKYENSLGFTDFYDGLIPDIALRDNLLGAPAFGDLNDEILSVAIDNILDIVAAQRKPVQKQFEEIIPKQIELRNNLMIHPEQK